MEEIKTDSYTLRTEDGQWLGQVVLTSDGLLGSVTDYGNFSYAWRSTGMPFKEFILSITTDYFKNKIIQGMFNMPRTKQIEHAVNMYSEKLLPALKKALIEEKNRISMIPDTKEIINTDCDADFFCQNQVCMAGTSCNRNLR